MVDGGACVLDLYAVEEEEGARGGGGEGDAEGEEVEGKEEGQ